MRMRDSHHKNSIIDDESSPSSSKQLLYTLRVCLVAELLVFLAVCLAHTSFPS